MCSKFFPHSPGEFFFDRSISINMCFGEFPTHFSTEVRYGCQIPTSQIPAVL